MGITYVTTIDRYRQRMRDMGKQMKFTGSGKILSTVTSSYTPLVPITITAWVKTSTVAGSTATTQAICVTKYFYLHMRLSSGVTNILCRFNSGSARQSLYPIYRLGQWIHVAAEYRPTSGTTASTYLWINGEMVATNDHPAIGSTTFVEGVGGYDSDYFVGTMDDVRIYNTNLGRDDIIDIFTGKDAPHTNLVAQYKFDDSNLTTVTDSSRFGNNGTFTGTGMTYITDPPFGLKDRSSISRSITTPNRSLV